MESRSALAGRLQPLRDLTRHHLIRLDHLRDLTRHYLIRLNHFVILLQTLQILRYQAFQYIGTFRLLHMSPLNLWQSSWS